MMEKGGKFVQYESEANTKKLKIQLFVEDPKAGTGEITYSLTSLKKKTKDLQESAKPRVYALSSNHGRVLVKAGQKVSPNQRLIAGWVEFVSPSGFSISDVKKGKVTKGTSIFAFMNKPDVYEIYVDPQTDKDYFEAIEIAERFQFGRSTTRLTRKLHPDLPVAFLTNLEELLVSDGTTVSQGDFLKDGIPDPREVLYLQGSRACAAEIIRGVQAIY
jgi:hypothetical protein